LDTMIYLYEGKRDETNDDVVIFYQIVPRGCTSMLPLRSPSPLFPLSDRLRTECNVGTVLPHLGRGFAVVPPT